MRTTNGNTQYQFGGVLLDVNYRYTPEVKTNWNCPMGEAEEPCGADVEVMSLFHNGNEFCIEMIDAELRHNRDAQYACVTCIEDLDAIIADDILENL